VPLHPAATVASALELLPRPDLDPFERLALAFLTEYTLNSARAYRCGLHAWGAWTLTVAGVHPLQARRHHVAAWVRQLAREPSARNGKPLAAASVARRWPACPSSTARDSRSGSSPTPPSPTSAGPKSPTTPPRSD
jgi:hypothetical protein